MEQFEPILQKYSKAQERLISVFNCFSQRDRKILMLYYFEGASFEEIASVFGFSQYELSELFRNIRENVEEQLKLG
ncbi:MAG TPA: sigma factor-like helix-turn-helix DNA-binding protein [Bacteroidota bacterium]|nr:sigma factor-like helix-turn-helix DNA-binding protein [Bacteroidota bacterium]